MADELLPAVYRAASVFALPSLAEGYGLPALEAMAAGVPVVASAIPALAEVCAGAALLVPPADAGAWARALTVSLAGGAAVSDRVVAGEAVAKAASWDRGGAGLGALLSRVARLSLDGWARSRTRAARRSRSGRPRRPMRWRGPSRTAGRLRRPRRADP